jgi:hypothetical protein
MDGGGLAIDQSFCYGAVVCGAFSSYSASQIHFSLPKTLSGADPEDNLSPTFLGCFHGYTRAGENTHLVKDR